MRSFGVVKGQRLLDCVGFQIEPAELRDVDGIGQLFHRFRCFVRRRGIGGFDISGTDRPYRNGDGCKRHDGEDEKQNIIAASFLFVSGYCNTPPSDMMSIRMS